MRFDKKVVVITGASSGLGRQLAIDFSSAGASVVLFSRNEDELKKTFELCNSPSASIVVGDVTNPKDCNNLSHYTLSKYEKVDILILNAGISMWAEFDKIQNIDVFKKLFDVNFWGTVNCFKGFSAGLHKSKGSVVVVSSLQGKIGVPYHTFYSASKHALQGFFNSLRFEFKDIHILTVLPHWVSRTNLRHNALNVDGVKTGEQKKTHTNESISVEKCSERILEAVSKRKSELILPFKLKMLTWLYNIYQPLAEKIISSKVHSQ